MAAMLRRLPVLAVALYKVPGGDLDHIELTITGLRYDTSPAAEQEAQ